MRFSVKDGMNSCKGPGAFRKLAICSASVVLTLTGCSSWCRDWPWLPENPPDKIVIYATPPAHNYFELGTVAVAGGPRSVAVINYRSMQTQAACMGGTGVILTDQVPFDEPDYWLYPHTGIAIRNATSSLQPN
jgi:hypothetical protein